jgi:hypothetical protein
MLDRVHVDVLRMRRALVLVALAAVIFAPISADAACNPESCDAFFACGTRECVGNSCVIFPESAGTVCRGAAGVCDRAETCNGNSLTCPSDTKRSAATVCRPAVEECDGAEKCDGVSNDCIAPDVGVAPLITQVSILDSELRFADGQTSPLRYFEVRISGDQLCEATVDGTPLPSPMELVPDASGTLVRNIIPHGAENPNTFPSATYQFDVNRGAVTGSLPYVAIDPDGPIEIASPAFGAVLSGEPTFTISNQCTNCGSIQRLEISKDVSTRIAETLRDLPIDTPVEIELDDFVSGLGPLAAGSYFFEAEAIAGPLVGEAFEEDPRNNEFFYLSGRSIRNRLVFDVPEPGLAGAGTTAVVALVGIGRLRGSRAGSKGTKAATSSPRAS